MTPKFLFRFAGLCWVAVCLDVSGCSHDNVTTTTAGMTIQYTPSPSGSGRYDSGTFQILNVTVVPADPARRSLIDPNNLALNVTMDVDLTSTTSASFNQVALSPGDYIVVGISYVSPVLKDNDPPSTPTTCIENIATVPSGPAVSQVPYQIDFSESDGIQFTVQPGQTVLEFKTDVPALIAGYEAAFTCDSDCGGGQACLTAFDESAYRPVLLNTIHIQ